MKICSEAGLLPRVARRNVSSIDNCYWKGNFDDFDYPHLKLTLNWAYHMKACAEEIQNECKTERSTSWTMEKVTQCKEKHKKSAAPWREKYVAQSSKKSAMKSSPSKVLQSSSMWMQGHTMGNLPWGATPRMCTWIQRSLQYWRRWRMSQCARPPSLKFHWSNTSNVTMLKSAMMRWRKSATPSTSRSARPRWRKNASSL